MKPSSPESAPVKKINWAHFPKHFQNDAGGHFCIINLQPCLSTYALPSGELQMREPSCKGCIIANRKSFL